MAGVRAALVVSLLVAAASHGVFAARQGYGRELLQSGVSCPAQIPACLARRCTTRILDSKETYVCLRCQKNYIPVKGSDGKSVVQCVCPPGTSQWFNSSVKTSSCNNCPVGSYCPGGNPKAKGPNDNIGGNLVDCNKNGTTGLTTKSDKSSRPADCVATAGYVLPATPGSSAQQCTGSTYAPAYNKLKACLPCQSGLATPPTYTGPHVDRMAVCQVPPGRFWELNVVRDCPQGLYREEFVRTDNKSAIACNSCPEGWTTAQISTDLLSKCNVLLPGYKAKDVPAGETNTSTIVLPGDSTDFTPYETEACPIGYYYDGTTATLGCVKCPYGSTTLQNASKSVDDCLVAPGLYVSTVSNIVEMCPTTPVNSIAPGYYRAGWKSYKEVMDSDGTNACTPCGAGIMSTPRDADERPGAANDSLVPSTAASCYINPGWGITFDPADFTKFMAIAPCPANTYGVANITYGLINAPCKACTKNLYSEAASTRFDACKNPGGFGYTSEGANQCPDGFWAAKDSMAPCEQCPAGRTTLYVPGNGTYQDSIDDCIVPPGSGVYNGNDTDPWNPTNGGNNNPLPAQPCPVGFYSDNNTIAASSGNNPTCQVCPNNSSTVVPGSTECTVCKAGYGKDNGVCSPCKYGGYNLGTSDSCMDCPSTTYNDFVGDGYTSYGITVRMGLKGPESCVPRYAQLPKPVGDRMGLPDDMLASVPVSGSSDQDFVKKCIEACPADKCCVAEIEKTDSGITCKHALLTPVESTATQPKMYYKLPPSEMAAASTGSKNEVLKKTISSGIYAVCDLTDHADEAKNGSIGTSNNPALVEAGRNAIEWNVQCSSAADCKKACDADATCWGFIWHPTAIEAAGSSPAQSAFALRGGESWLGGRTFFTSPDGNQAAAIHLDTLGW